MEYKNKTFHYKCARFAQANGSLQQMLSDAVARLPKAFDRREDINDSKEHYRLLNQTKTERGTLCGVVFSYHEGHSQAITAVDADAATLDIEKIAPPKTSKGKRSEFIEGLLYFCCSRNHLAVVASSALQTTQLEEYLNWLFKDQTNVMSDDNTLMIADPHKPDLKQGISEVKSINFKTTMSGSAVVDKEQTISEKHAKKLSFKPEGKTWDAITALFSGMGVDLPNNIRIDQGIYPEDLEVSVEIKCKKRRDQIEGGTPFLDPIANAFRHMDHLPFDLTMRDGSVVKGDDFKVAQMHSVSCDEGIPDTTDTFKKMCSWLEKVIQSGQVLSDAS